jgi:hypothetical protein
MNWKKLKSKFGLDLFAAGLIATISSPFVAVAFHPACVVGVPIGLVMIVAGYKIVLPVSPS